MYWSGRGLRVLRILNAIDKLPLQRREALTERLRSRKPQLEVALQQSFERREELLRVQQRAVELQAIVDEWNKEGEKKQVFDENTDIGDNEDVDLDTEDDED